MAEQYKFPDELEDDKNQKVEIVQPEGEVEIEIGVPPLVIKTTF